MPSFSINIWSALISVFHLRFNWEILPFLSVAWLRKIYMVGFKKLLFERHIHVVQEDTDMGECPQPWTSGWMSFAIIY